MNAALIGLVASGLAIAQPAEPAFDKIFERFTGTSAGCAVGVVRDGKVAAAKAYGLADLEHGAPLTTDSPFYMASVSKQFTAMAVLMLVRDGKVALTDSIRKTHPELPEYAGAVTLYHLLTHTGGVRDYLTLGSLAGWPSDMVYTDDSALRMIARQRALNFAPGSEYLYSNSGYFLLSQVVKRVSGQDLNAFAQERIFGPLRMTSTRFQHNHAALVPGRAIGYTGPAAAPQIATSMLDVVGDGGLYSSVGDMLRWAANFDGPKVGAEALTTMQTRGRLSEGREISYGMGLQSTSVRGLPAVDHGGSLAGYRTAFLRIPERRLTVVCLCNTASAAPAQLVRQVADLYLTDLPPAPIVIGAPLSPIYSPSAAEVQAYAGLYRNDRAGYLDLLERGGKLVQRWGAELTAVGRGRFTIGTAPGIRELSFGGGSPAPTVEVRPAGQPALVYERVEAASLSEAEQKAYAGNYRSPELDCTYRILMRPGGLVVEAGERSAVPLLSGGADRWRTAAGLELVFRRDASGRIDGFTLNAGRVMGVRFVSGE